jgi:hypothetical protein
MFEVIKRAAFSFVFGLCIVGLALHFTAESIGAMQDHFLDGQMQETFDSHEKDQFMLNEPESNNYAQESISFPLAYRLKAISRLLPPPLQPPKPV